MANRIINFAPQQASNTANLALDAQKVQFQPFSVNLTEEEKDGVRTMGRDREGYARLVGNIAEAHEDSLARHQNAADLSIRLAYDTQLEGMRQRTATYLEMITETQIANGIDIMDYVDKFVKVLQANRNDVAALDLAMREVDDYNARFGRKTPPTEPQQP